MSHYCGIDFGTSNSVVTVLKDEKPIVMREPSLMFFPDSRDSSAERYCGSRALEEYLSRGMRGRFFQSVKSILPDPGFTHTKINGKPFNAEQLVAVMLRFLRSKAEEASGTEITRAVLGRPARFSEKPDREKLAQERLERAVALAGIEEAHYELEPVAGAHAYAAKGNEEFTSSERQVFVADHGGGTSDFTYMTLRGTTGLERGDILATHGIRAGGDDFDASVMWNSLVPYFGYGATFESFGKMLPVPVHIFRILSRWDRIHFLKTLSYREEFRSYLRSSDNPRAIRRLISLVENDLGYFVARAVEAAKIALSDVDRAVIDYEYEDISIYESLQRADFESFVAEHIARISEAVAETLDRAGRYDVDTVFLTGGSSRVPVLRRVFEERFKGALLIDDADQFQSVSLGLALLARQRGLANRAA